ncbi:BRO1-domain-containing protein [Amylostereum chailletii]|nr:BRO1-domain-containing protein [Amylostereum chailletii]
MPNQLAIPSKKSYVIPISDAVASHIHAHHTDTHPDAFKADVRRWISLRASATSAIVHLDSLTAILSYHAQLVFILTKFPPDIGLQVSFDPVFAPTNSPVTLSNLHYERCSILFNLAARYSQLAAMEDRSKPEGVKQASAYYQYAAGSLSYLSDTALPKLLSTLVEECSPDLSAAFLKTLEWLMLAQAQECVWQRAVLDHRTNGVIAKLAAQVSSYYGLALSTVREAPAGVRYAFPSGWLAHVEVKQMHFDAASQYRKSVDDVERNNYGFELARLIAAQQTAKKGYDVARRAGEGVAAAVREDVKSLLDIVEKNLKRAERDNDLIYHHDVPSTSTLPIIPPTSMVRQVVPPTLQDPKAAVGDQPVLFSELLSWGARTAIEIYNDRRQTFVKEEIEDLARELDDKRLRTLRDLSLPGVVEALDKPIGLPPSLLRKAEEVRTDSGPQRVEKSIEDVQMLARRAAQILDDALDILDQEASEDEKQRRADAPVQRQPSHEANEELTNKAARYRSILEQAAESDGVVRKRWEDWEPHIVELTWDEAVLEASVPSSTMPAPGSRKASGTTAAQTHARALRVHLEELDDLAREREDLVRRANRRKEADDIHPRILKAAAGVERWAEVQPSMFEDVLEDELAKYDKFRNDVAQGGVKQDEILEAVKARMQEFLASRREDESVKEREHALQSLDLAYHKYKDIMRHLDEGLQFYNDLAAILMRFKQTCKDWVALRRDELVTLSRSMRSMSLQHDSPPRPAPSSPPQSPAAKPQASRQTPPQTPAVRAPRKIALDLPPPDSDQWQTVDMPAPPSARSEKKTRRK